MFEPNSVDFGIIDKVVEYCYNDIVATEEAFNRLTDVFSTINESNRIKYNKMYVKKEDKKMDIKLYECGTFVGGIVTKPQDLIKNVIFSGPCTIVQWTDGDKTIVRCENENFDKEKGLAMAIVKKLFGTNESKSNYNDIFKKWLPEKKDHSSNPFGNEIFCEDCEHYHSNASTHLCSKCANSATSYYTPRKK